MKSKHLYFSIVIFTFFTFFSCNFNTSTDITAIAIETMPQNINYFQNETLDLTGMVVHTVYSDGRYTLVEDYETEPEEGSVLAKTGKQKVTVKAQGKKTYFTINVAEVKISSLTIYSMPDKLIYTYGDELNFDGLVLLAKYNNGIEKFLTAKDITTTPATGTVLNKAGVQKVELKYGGEKLSFQINVQEKEPEYSEVPVILEEPKDVRAIIGQSTLLSIYMAKPKEGELIYQWYVANKETKSFEIIPNATNTSLEIYSRGIEEENRYFVVIKNICDGKISSSVQSNIVNVSFIEPIKILSQTGDISFELYSDYQMPTLQSQYQVNAPGTVKIHWYKKGQKGTSDILLFNEYNQYLYSDDGICLSSSFTVPENDFEEHEVNTHYFYSKIEVLTENNSYSICSEVMPITVKLPETNIPTLLINTDKNIPITSKEEWISAKFILNSDENIEYSQNINCNIEIRGRGNTSWTQPKKPYAIKFYDETEILGLKKSKHWVLIANYSDKSLIRNSYVSKIGNEIFTNMPWNPSFRHVNLILNNEYLGNYIIGEKIEIAENKINIQNIAKTCRGIGKDLNGDGVVDYKDGGFIFEINKRMNESFNFTTKKGIWVSLKDPDTDDFEPYIPEVQEYIKTIIQTAEDALYSSNFKDIELGYSKYFDVPSFIDWYITNEFTKNNDACYFASVYLYYNPLDQKIYSAPNWDFDISCGNINYNGCDNYKGWWINRSRWPLQFFKDETIKSSLKYRWNEIQFSLYESITDEIKNESDFINVSANVNFKRWDILGTYVWPNANGYNLRTTYESEVEYMIDWLKKRYEWFSSAIEDF